MVTREGLAMHISFWIVYQDGSKRYYCSEHHPVFSTSYILVQGNEERPICDVCFKHLMGKNCGEVCRPYKWMMETGKHFTMRDGKIIGPGRFQGEPLWVAYFWSLAMDGWADLERVHNGITVYTFDLTDEDRSMFEDLGGKLTISLVESEESSVFGVSA